MKKNQHISTVTITSIHIQCQQNKIKGNDEEKQHYDSDKDDCTHEAFIDPQNKTRRKAIYNTSNANDDIIKCIGSLRILYDDKNVLTDPPEASIGTGTIYKIDEQNRCYILTVAHNAWQILRECRICNKRTLESDCSKCNQRTFKLKPVTLVKPTSIEFIRRCILQERTDVNTGARYTFGDPESVYEIDKYYLPEILYKLWRSPISGYDICIMIFQCKNNEIAMYKNICPRIQLKCDKTLGGNKNRLFLYGYPNDKYKIKNNDKQYQMYGMSTGMSGNKFKIEKHAKSGKEYIVNNQIDTQAGQSGSAIWSYGSSEKFNVYGVHSGGNEANQHEQRKLGVNYGTFLDEENLNWIRKIENMLSVQSSLGNNNILQSKFEQIQQQHQEQLYKLKQEFEKLKKRHHEEVNELKQKSDRLQKSNDQKDKLIKSLEKNKLKMHEKNQFDLIHISKWHKVVNQKLIAVSRGWSVGGSSYCLKSIVSGIHQYKFRIGKMSNYMIIGVWKIQQHITPPTDQPFTRGEHQGYGFDVYGGFLRKPENGKPGDKYGVKCKPLDMIEMIINFSDLCVSYKINGNDCGKAFVIKPAQYKVALFIDLQDDWIELLN
eukprot:483682_1